MPLGLHHGDVRLSVVMRHHHRSARARRRAPRVEPSGPRAAPWLGRGDPSRARVVHTVTAVVVVAALVLQTRPRASRRLGARRAGGTAAAHPARPAGLVLHHPEQPARRGHGERSWPATRCATGGGGAACGPRALVGITVTGLVHFALLRPLLHLDGASWVADKLLHMVVPVLAVVGWLVAGPRPRAPWRDALTALAWPVAWLAWTLVGRRGQRLVPLPVPRRRRRGCRVGRRDLPRGDRPVPRPRRGAVLARRPDAARSRPWDGRRAGADPRPRHNDRVPTPATPDAVLDPAIAARLKRDAAGLVAAVVQQHDTGEVLMLGWMDDEALHRTLTTGRATYWSRSRQEYWVKGDTSGHVQYVRSVAARLRRRRPARPGRPGRRGLPHRRPHLLRRRRPRRRRR